MLPETLGPGRRAIGFGRRAIGFGRRHPSQDLVAIAGIWARLVLVDLRLKIVPHRLNRAWIFGHDDAIRTIVNQDMRTEAMRLDHLVCVAAGHPLFLTMSCLRRALVLRTLLSEKGIAATLVFGMGSCPGETGRVAHAWLEAGDLKMGLGSPPNEMMFTAFQRK